MDNSVNPAEGDLRKLQLLEFEILKKVKDICDRYDITYFLSGGTLLGAVRHRGFIPWDNDVDVAMPRPDYERFLKIAEKELEYPYDVLIPNESKDYLFPFTKIIDRRAKVKTSSRKNEQIWYVWADIFPLDSMPKNKLHFTLRKYHILFRRMMYMYSCFDDMVTINKKNRPMVERIMIRFGSLSHLERFLDTSKQIRKYNQCLCRYPFSKGYYIINLMGVYKFKSVMERSIYGKKTEIPFEGVNFRVPEQYDLYLKRIYNDYMSFPPEDQRNLHQIELIPEPLTNLNESTSSEDRI